ncbi:MAG TPA: alpha/beta hydrolase [Ktedonobacteraceae bacterium]|nr:alpha/beta hydrolase [Ktedonobacteraceae bacterium]
MSIHLQPWISDAAFHDDVHYLETRWQRTQVGSIDLPLIDIGQGRPLVFVPILEHLEFVYARQIQTLSQSRRVILYRRQETRNTPPMELAQRAEELRAVLDSLALEQVDLLGHGDAAMVLFEFALRYPQRCRSLIIISQAADYQIAPHPLIWLLHELLLRLPAEYIVPASFLRRTVVNYIMAHDKHNQTMPALPRHLVEEQFSKIEQWPFVYKFSVLPIIHYFDIRARVKQLTMPILLINRADDTLAPEAKTQWLAQQLPACKNYHVVAGKERFFMYSQAAKVTPLIEAFLASEDAHDNQPGQLQQQEKQ